MRFAIQVVVRQADADENNPSGKDKILYGLQEVLPILLIVVGLLLLTLLLRDTYDGRPFGRGQSRRMTGLGWLLILGLPAIAVTRHLLADAVLPSAALDSELEPPPLFTLFSLGPGVLVLALAVAFRHGAALQELEDTTV